MESAKYQEGKIYKIVDVGYHKCYIGSTVEKLSKRKTKHRNSYRRFLQGDAGKTTVFDIFDEYGIDNCKIELVEKHPCSDREELKAREGFHIKSNECVNKRIEGRTRKEYKNDNNDKIKMYTKQYYDTHRQELINTKMEYYKNNKDVLLKNMKDYYETHKEQHLEAVRKYREENRERIAAKFRETIKCSCGCTINKYNMPRHLKSLKHQNLMNTEKSQVNI